MLYFCTVIQFIANKEKSLFVVNLNDGAAFFTRLIIIMTIKITGFVFRNLPEISHTPVILLLFNIKAREIKTPRFEAFCVYSASVPTDMVIRRIPLLIDFSLFILAFIISPV